ncbi:MAG: glycosyltransferase [Oscillospiraceae bacterium]|jgi:glycosyltransferase involved in cell wall biosynthesis|nr:glycosyltransferase [Oscillospiraceae bacterium]
MMDYNEFRNREYERRDKRLQDRKPMTLQKGKPGKEFLRIVYVMTWTGICGGSKVVFEHCNRLSQRGHQVTVLCHLPRPDWFALDPRVEFIQPAYEEVLCERIPACDVIVATYWKEIYECVEQNIAPVVYFEQGDTHLFEPGAWDAGIMAHVRKQMEVAPFVYTVSRFAAEKLSECFNVSAGVIPNAVDRTVFNYDPAARSGNKKPVVTTIGPDYIHFKRLPEILSAVRRLREKGIDFEFIWITPGNPAAGVTEAALVNPTQHSIGECLRRTDIYVCASMYESFCLPVLEAMTCGAAIVTTDCGGIGDYVRDGENALVVKEPGEIVSALERLIRDADLRKRLSENGLKTAEQFDWDITADKLTEYYKEIAAYQVVAQERPEGHREFAATEGKVMNTVSLCMIVKDEEKVLARCLDSVKDAVDEIIIVDTGSADATKAIASRYTDKIYDFEWVDDFSEARNFSFSKATMDYQMWMDADDILPEGGAQKLAELKKHLDPTVDIVTMRYITHFDENGNPVHYSTRERLIRREKGYVWLGPVHECIPLIGKVIHCDVELHHKKIEVHQDQQGRNLRIYEALEKSGKPFDPRSLYYYARELRDHGMWIKAAYYFEKFLDGNQGWAEDNIAACFSLAGLYKALGDYKKIVPILLRSFEYAPPRAEICCEIGYYYKNAKDFAAALDWFKIAASLEQPKTNGFVLVDYYGYIPNIEGCVCSFELGDYHQSYRLNEAAARYKPDSPAIELNRSVLKGRVSE